MARSARPARSWIRRDRGDTGGNGTGAGTLDRCRPRVSRSVFFDVGVDWWGFTSPEGANSPFSSALPPPVGSLDSDLTETSRQRRGRAPSRAFDRNPSHPAVSMYLKSPTHGWRQVTSPDEVPNRVCRVHLILGRNPITLISRELGEKVHYRDASKSRRHGVGSLANPVVRKGFVAPGTQGGYERRDLFMIE